MKKRQHGFDFSEARKPFDEGRKNGIDPCDNVAAWKALPDFPAFAAWWLSEDRGPALHHNYLDFTGNNLAASVAKNLNFWNPDFATNQITPSWNGSPYQKLVVPSRPVRSIKTFALSLNDTIKAEEFMRKNPRFTLAMLAFQSCVFEYIQKLYEELGVDYSRRSFAATTRNNVSVSSIVGELGPIMAESLHHEETPFTQKSLGKALCSVFRRQAFKSADPGKSMAGTYPYNECPFASGLAQALQINFTENAGRLHAREGQGHGALILFLMEYLPRRYPDLLNKLTSNPGIPDNSL